MRVFGARYPVSFACFVLALGLLTASGAAAQGAPCPGGRFVTGFQLQVSAPGRSAAIPFTQINNLDQGDVLHYAPQALPPEWRKSARVAALLVPAAYSASAHLAVFTGRADRTASWKVPEQTAAIAFLFGPKGLNANNTRRMLDQHPELVAHFITYAEQASRVEALVALLARYENSPPGTLDLNTLLKQYSREYGVAMPKANPALPPDQEAAVMLAAVAPPTAEPGPSKHADLTAGSTSTATALATLYYGPVMGLASDAMPLFRALHKTMFPGMQFQGAFAQPDAGGARLCGANTAPPPNKHTVYIWMANLPTGTAPSVRLAKATTATLAAGTNARLQVTCASVAQLRDLMRARQWELVPVKGKPVSIKVQVAPGALNDTLTLDLTHDSHLTGDYYLAAMWDWTPVNVAGTIAVQAPTGLQGATLAPGDAARLIAEGGVVTVTVAGTNFSLVNKVELAGASEPFALADGGKQLHVTIDTAQLAAGVHQLRLEQAAGSARELALTVLPPNPRVDAFRANVDEGSQRITLHGTHLERIARLTSADADITLARLPASIPANGLDQRPAIVHLTASAQPGQVLSAKVYVVGSADPLGLAHAINVLGPRPRISAVDQSVNAGQTVALKPKELPADATVNFAFTIEHAPPVTEVHLRCQSPNDQIQPLTLHAGDTSGTAELESSGNGRYYLAAVAGKIGAPGCDLQMIVPDASAGNSNAYLLGRVVLLPRIHSLTLSDQSAAPGEFAGTLSGDNLQLIAKTGWNASTGIPVTSVPMRVNPSSAAQTLAIAMPWPPPSPHAPLYIWLRGESRGRATTVTQ
ncbi:MAG: hypothetical protein EPN33_14585 [Acidobacteria bacterium]|nr:MAG: hypothetical protein EPN33_14585 [Acidobacteriota bacterium]